MKYTVPAVPSSFSASTDDAEHTICSSTTDTATATTEPTIKDATNAGVFTSAVSLVTSELLITFAEYLSTSETAFPCTHVDAKLLPHDRGPLLENLLGILFVHAVKVEDIFESFDGPNVFNVLVRHFTFDCVDERILFRDDDPFLFDSYHDSMNAVDNILEVPISFLSILREGLQVMTTLCIHRNDVILLLTCMPDRSLPLIRIDVNLLSHDRGPQLTQVYAEVLTQECQSFVPKLKVLHNDTGIDILLPDGAFTFSNFVDVTTENSMDVPDWTNAPTPTGSLFEGTNAWTVPDCVTFPSCSFEANADDSFEDLYLFESSCAVEFSNDRTVLIAAMCPMISHTDFTGLPPSLDAYKNGLPPSLDAFMNDLIETSPGNLNTNASLGPASAPMQSTPAPTHLLMNTSLTDSNYVAFSNIISYKPTSLNVQWSLNLQDLPDSGTVMPQVDVFVQRLVHTRVNVELLPCNRGPSLIVVGVVNCRESTNSLLKIELFKMSPFESPARTAALPSTANSTIMADACELNTAFDLLRSIDETSSLPTVSMPANGTNAFKLSKFERSLHSTTTCVDVKLLPHDRGSPPLHNCFQHCI